MKLKLNVRGWLRAQGEQTVVNRPIRAMEHRTDDLVIPTGTTRATSDGVRISFRGRATCSPNSNYMFSFELSEADLEQLLDLCRRRDDDNLFGLVQS